MKPLPNTDSALVLRTDFSDVAGWTRVQQEIEAPVGEFRAYVSFLSDPEFDGISAGELLEAARRGPYRSFIFVADRECLGRQEHPILVLDLVDEPGRCFRVVPREMWSVENNLSLANMDFADFAEGTDSDNVFRGFPEE